MTVCREKAPQLFVARGLADSPVRLKARKAAPGVTFGILWCAAASLRTLSVRQLQRSGELGTRGMVRVLLPLC